MRRFSPRWLVAWALFLAAAVLIPTKIPRAWEDKGPRLAPATVLAKTGAGDWSSKADYQRLLTSIQESSRQLRHEQLHRLMHQQRRNY